MFCCGGGGGVAIVVCCFVQGVEIPYNPKSGNWFIAKWSIFDKKLVGTKDYSSLYVHIFHVCS